MKIDTIGSIFPAVKKHVIVSGKPSVSIQSTAMDGFVSSVNKTNYSADLRFGATFKPKEGVVSKYQQSGVLVSGAWGTMGTQILDSFYQNQFKAMGADRDMEFAQDAVKKAVYRLNGTFAKKPQIYNHIVKNTPLESIDTAKLVSGEYQADPNFKKIGIAIEAIPENLGIKQKWVQMVEPLMTEDGILGINTSSLLIDDVAKAAKKPENVAGYHYFTKMPLPVEIIAGEKTSPQTMKALERVARATGKIPFSLPKDSPLAVGNRLFTSPAIEAARMVEEGMGDAQTIEEVAVQVFWPQFVNMPGVVAKLPTPLKMLNQYGAMGYEILVNAGKIGPYFKTPDSIVGEHNRVQGIVNGPLKQAKAEFADVEKRYNEAQQVWTQQQLQLPMSKHAQLREALGLDKLTQELEQAQAKRDNLLEEAKYFKTLPASHAETQTFPKGCAADFRLRKQIEQRFLGVYYLAMMQMASEGLMRPDDIDSLTKIAFHWDVKPLPPAELSKTVEAFKNHYKTTYNIDLKVPTDVDLTKMNWVKTAIDPKTGVLTITLNRAQKLFGGDNLNTLSTPTLKAIQQAVVDANQDPSVKAIVLEANGGKIFSGGANLDEIRGQKDAAKVNEYIQLGRQVMDTIATSRKPTIAKMQGDAYGGGVELALACKWIVATENTTFTLPEVNLGIFPAWGGTERLPQKIGKPIAKALILGGKTRNPVAAGMPKAMQDFINKGLRWDLHGAGARLDAQTAHQLGLVQVLVPQGHLDDAMDELIAEGRFSQDAAHGDEAVATRGLKRFANLSDYPQDIQEKFQLADAENETKRNVGRFSDKAWALANNLIDNCDNDKAGKFTPEEFKELLECAAAKDELVGNIIQVGVATFNKDTDGANKILRNMLLSDKRFLPAALGFLKAGLGKSKSPKPNQAQKSLIGG